MGRKQRLWSQVPKEFKVELMKSAKEMNKTTQRFLIEGASNFLDDVQENKSELPYLTGNLHDSIVATVSQSGRIVRALYMPKEATRKQYAQFRRPFWGADEAVRAVRRINPPRTGVCATLIVAVPYAEGVNTQPQHLGYKDSLEVRFANLMKIYANNLKYAKISPQTSVKPSRFL